MEPVVQDSINLPVGHTHNAVDREHAATASDFNGVRLGRPLYSVERRAYNNAVPGSRCTLIRSLRRPRRELVPCQQCQALRADLEID